MLLAIAGAPRGFSLDEWADHFLKLDHAPRVGRPPQRAFHSEQDMLRRARQREIPYGRHLQRFGYTEDGLLLFSDERERIELP